MQGSFEVTTFVVRCLPSGREARVLPESLLIDAVTQVGLPLGQSCDGVALCGFCRVRVLDGAASLSPAGSEERKLLASLRAGVEERLACCARVHGPVTITTTYW